MSFQLSFIIVACAVLAFVQAQRDPYTIEVARNFEGSYKEHQAPGSDSSPFKNGARPSFRVCFCSWVLKKLIDFE